MYLRSLELQGFKSFPDKTVLKFDKGITAVVGPNGSGKSNIADAMRWVMGEQSSKTLRGEKMQGVIFHGTQTRPKAPFAQVTISIDNEDRALDFDSDVVSVSRKLYRNGDSEYMINGGGVRLKDVTELFLDTGLGKDGYSIIGQGRIADIINGKSGDRREIFEEAAGIAKFRYKKKEAESKLVAAQDNISRLNDIIAELESRIGPLKNQCEKAKKFRILDEEKRKLEVSVWVRRLEGYMSELNGYAEKLRAMREQYEALSEELADAEEEIEDDLAVSAQKAQEADDLKNKIHETELENTQANADIAVLENDISHLEDNILQLKEQIEQSRASKYYLETELEKRREDLKTLIARQESGARLAEDKEREFSLLISQAEESDKNVTKANNAVNAVYLKKSEVSFKLESAKNSISDIQEQIAHNCDNIKETEGSCRLSGSELKKLREEKAKADESKEETANRLSGMTKLYDARREKLQAALDEISRTDIAYREAAGKLQLLQDLENSMEGFSYSVKHIMKAVKQGRISGVCGSAAQLISVDSEYSVAIETALGGALQNIVVDNEDAAKRGIRILKENNAGRATFLPVTSVKGTRLENRQLEQENGFVALACDLVRYDPKFTGVINYLLGRICIAEDIDFAGAIAKKYGYKFRIVTPDGQVVNAGGSFTGGSVSKSTGILTRKNEIEELERKKSSLENKRSELSVKKEKLSNEVNKFAADIEGLKEQLNIAGSSCIKLEMEIKRVSEFHGQYKAALDEAQALGERLSAELAEAEKKLEDASQELIGIDREILDMETELETSQNKQGELREKRERLSGELSELRVRNAELAKDTEACRESVSQLISSIESSDSDSGKTEQGIIELEKNIADKREEIGKIKDKIAGSGAVIEGIKAQIETARREHLEYSNRAAKIRSAQKNKLDEKENLSGQINRTEERQKNISAEFDKLVSQLWDEYELTRSGAAEIAEEIEDMTEANKRLAELRNKIRALGNVNLEAIDEYAEVSERYEFMSAQLEDVNTSKLELEKLIYDLTENMKSVFIHSFERINDNFRTIFGELFGGGKGELILTDPDDVLECGIEINAQPPGKVITNLMSLSGGEQALTAIAIYFAILKNSPSPFCLLDEIEAALDDVNVARYAQYLHRLTDKTQFIAITHRRGTMEEANVLYGVTMQEKGISKLLKMNADETRHIKLE